MILNYLLQHPPTETLKLLVSMAASQETQSNDVYGCRNPFETVFENHNGKIIMGNDIRRAYFYAQSVRKVFVELPDEDRADDGEAMCGELMFSMYGTRDAAQNWEREYSSFLVGLGFRRGSASPCQFYHPGRDISTVVHGDDFTSLANSVDLNWLQQQLEAKYSVKTQLLGPGYSDEIRILNRVIRWTSDGLTMEADPRHAEIIIRELGLEDAKAVQTPGIDNLEVDGGEQELSSSEATRYRAIAARCNYLSLDRVDIQFATKEVARRMSKPTVKDMARLKRLGRYLIGAPRVVCKFPWQLKPAEVRVFTDADWAGCRETRKSTSGGALMLGCHLIRSYSKTQQVIALSSAESEFYAAVKASIEGLGLCSLARDYGYELKPVVMADANAALGIINRRGFGKVRHLDTQHLWVQDAAARKAIMYRKEAGSKNPADVCTKHVEAWRLQEHLCRMSVECRSDRATSAPTLT